MDLEVAIADWAKTLPGWKQNVLVHLAEVGAYANDSIGEIADQVMKDPTEAPGKALTAQDISGLKLGSPPVRLVALQGTKNINALTEGEKLGFGRDGMTVVFGQNGSGKSGYARLIKSSVGARDEAVIHRHAFDQQISDATQSAEVTFEVGDDARDPHCWPGKPATELNAISFFDERCGKKYISVESAFSYRPSALSLLDDLIEISDKVKQIITKKLDENEKSSMKTLALEGGTPSETFLDNLSADTTQAEIDEATSLAGDHEEELAKRLMEEARLKGTDPTREKARLRELATNIDVVNTHIDSIEAARGAEFSAKIVEMRKAARELRIAADQLSKGSFDNELLAGVGSKAWRSLWESARSFSELEAYPDHEFPHVVDGSLCLLCQQPIGPDASTRLERFDRFLKDQSESHAKDAEAELKSAETKFDAIEYLPVKVSKAIAAITGNDEDKGKKVRIWLEALSQNHATMLACFKTSSDELPPAMPDSPSDELKAWANSVRADAANLSDTEFKAQLARAVASRAELDDQIKVSKEKVSIESEVERLKTKKKLKVAEASASTTAITNKATSLEDIYVTQAAKESFERELSGLGLSQVELVKTRGKKGKSQHVPKLKGAVPGVDTLPEILSEGEQTALALAGLFVELELDESKSGLVLDDPVSSLDHVRRDRVANRLAGLAESRQVIVFTHDISFVRDLSRACGRSNCTMHQRHIQRRGDGRVGFVDNSHPWKASDVSSRIGKLNNELSSLESKAPNMLPNEYDEKCASFAHHLSQAWEGIVSMDIANVIYNRGTGEIAPRMMKILGRITEGDIKEFDVGYGRTGAWVRHDQDSEQNYVAPSVTELREELDRLKAWFERLKKYKTKK